MFMRRSTGLLRAVALLLLVWTATDLGLPQVCTIDATHTAPAIIVSLDNDGPVPGVPFPTDDCFCCSHCIVLNIGPASLSAVGPTALPREAARLPLWRTADPAYHPPALL